MKLPSTRQKAKSSTTSSKLNTSKGLETPIQFVKGVGPKLGSVLSARGISTIYDLIYFFPRAYQDRTKLFTISELKTGMLATVAVQIQSARKTATRHSKRSIFEARCSDSTGVMSLKWFHTPWGMDKKFIPGTSITVIGEVKEFMGNPEMIHPEVSFKESISESQSGRIVPIYTELEGIPTRTFRNILWEALKKFSNSIKDDIPIRFLKNRSLPLLGESIQNIHFPSQAISSDDFNSPFHHRIIYDEFFKFEYIILRKKLNLEKLNAVAFKSDPTVMNDLKQALPFELTKGQLNAIQDIITDLHSGHPMNRLIQGDVGSGKTAVALLAAGYTLAQGSQCALMAPTEILAEQHFLTASKLLGSKIKLALLTGKTLQSERTQLNLRLANGEPILVIGTHALIEDPVIFKSLDIVLIDEQHRFGVEQRLKLKSKGIRNQLTPHSIVMTATPIPRTLALTAFGDLSISVIKERPPGRSPILTKVIKSELRTKALERIRDELKKGHQAYFIYPLVSESEAEGFTELKSAIQESEALKAIYPEYKVGLLHGQMSSAEKSIIMEKFKNNEIQVLVSTTVVEVGVDVPNATVMAIEHSERFGLSQLHQLRGRVGRGQAQSICFLFTRDFQTDATAIRLGVLEKTNDGFEIAEADLMIRGPGEFLGVRQSGSLPFKLADIVRDAHLLLAAREDANFLLKVDPENNLPENLDFKQYIENKGQLFSDLIHTG